MGLTYAAGIAIADTDVADSLRSLQYDFLTICAKHFVFRCLGLLIDQLKKTANHAEKLLANPVLWGWGQMCYHNAVADRV
jgi:hypothetical protein